MKKMKTIKNILAHTVLTLLAIVWVSPLVWIILTSFRAQKGAYTSSFFPKSYSLDNYIKLFTDTGILNFPRMFTNTLIVAVFSCIISTFFVLSVAYCMSRLKFKMRKAMMNVAMILGLFPAFMAMIAVYYILKALSLTIPYFTAAQVSITCIYNNKTNTVTTAIKKFTMLHLQILW